MMLAVMLTARIGTIQYDGHKETWYDLRMERVCQRAAERGIDGEYWERADGCKMYGKYIICAADWELHPYGSEIELSRGLGIVLDTHTAEDRTIVDIATTWGK